VFLLGCMEHFFLLRPHVRAMAPQGLNQRLMGSKSEAASSVNPNPYSKVRGT
jgi:hypothetical protein